MFVNCRCGWNGFQPAGAAWLDETWRIEAPGRDTFRACSSLVLRSRRTPGIPDAPGNLGATVASGFGRRG
jgi:hypothetical protein